MIFFSGMPIARSKAITFSITLELAWEVAKYLSLPLPQAW
jgi:hypothetical protein